MTNYERIKNMTIEQMTEWFHTDVNFCWQCPRRKETCLGKSCKEAIKEWLGEEEDE